MACVVAVVAPDVGEAVGAAVGGLEVAIVVVEVTAVVMAAVVVVVAVVVSAGGRVVTATEFVVAVPVPEPEDASDADEDDDFHTVSPSATKVAARTTSTTARQHLKMRERTFADHGCLLSIHPEV